MSLDLLSDEQLIALGKYQNTLYKVNEAVRKLNELKNDNGLDIRTVDSFQLGMAMSDSQQIARTHFNVKDADRAAAMLRLEKAAA